MQIRARTVLTVLGLAAVVVATTGAPALAADRSPIAGSHPSWASPANQVSTMDSAQSVTFRVYLNLRDESAAEAAAQAVSTQGSPSFRQYLSTDEVRARYAPSTSSVAAVTSWLRSSGFSIGQVPANNLY